MMGLVGKADRSSAQLSIPPRGGNAGRNSHAATWANSPEPGCPGLRLRKIARTRVSGIWSTAGAPRSDGPRNMAFSQWSPRSLTGRSQDLDRGAWAHDPRVVEVSQVLVAGNEQVSRRAEQGDEVTIVAVTRRRGNLRRVRQIGRASRRER